MGHAFQPLSVRLGRRDPLPLTEDVPERIWSYLDKWLRAADRQHVIGWQRYIMGTEFASDDLPFGMNDFQIVQRRAQLRGSDEYLDVVDFVLQQLPAPFGSLPEVVTMLENEILAPSNVNWTVSNDWPYRLIERVRPETLRMANSTIENLEDHPSRLLREAWTAAYQREPDPKTAWERSRSAIESLLVPIVCPNNPRATISTCRRDLLAAPSKWTCSFPLFNMETPDQAVTKLAELLKLFPYEPGHHGDDPRTATLDEARTQVMFATPLCQLLHDGFLQRVEK